MIYSRRLSKLQIARIIVLNIIRKAALNSDDFKIYRKNYIKILIGLESERIIVAGAKERKFVDNITLNQLEDMLNLLYQFGDIRKYRSKLSGNIFEADIFIPRNAENNIIKLNTKKAA